MGIKFYCPECGDKLNVKDFLAGKRGICPRCQAGIDIPLHSTRGRGAKQNQSAVATAEADDDDVPQIDISGPATRTAVSDKASPPDNSHTAKSHSRKTDRSDKASRSEKSGRTPSAAEQPAEDSPFPVINTSSKRSSPSEAAIPAVTNAGAAPTSAAAPGLGGKFVPEPIPKPASDSPAAPFVAPTPATSMPTMPSAPVPGGLAAFAPMAPAPSAVADAISENPQAVWYVKHPTGGQYGPAKGDVMRRWLQEGRVSADSFVWREGWPQWKRADESFAELRVPTPTIPAPTAVMPMAGPAFAVAAPVTGLESDPLAPSPSSRVGSYHRRRSNSGRIVAIIVLMCAVLILIPALIYVLMNQH